MLAGSREERWLSELCERGYDEVRACVAVVLAVLNVLDDEKQYDAVILLTGSRDFHGDTHIHLGER